MTSSVQPPVLDPSLGTPSNEWAKKITSSLDPSSQETSQAGQGTGQSPGVTPGSELPGAFPDRGQGETSTGATNITETIVDTAKQYLPTSVVNTVGTLLGGSNGNSTATDNEVRASEHDIYHKTSLPSQELRGALPREHVGGVGSLPGASVEKSVALLPDEQPEWSEWDTFAGRNTPGYQTPSNVKGNATSLSQTVTQKATGLGIAAGIIKADAPPKQTTEDVDKGYPETLTSGDISGAKQAVGNIKPVAFDIKQAPHDVSMPSTETKGQQPGEHTDGAGSLPGTKDEQGVAVLPEERETKTTETVRPEHREEPSDLPGETSKSTGTSGVGVGGATDPLKKDTESRDIPSETATSEPKTVSSEPVTSEPKTLTSEPKTVTSEPKTTGSEPGKPRSESENVTSVQRSGGSEGSAEGQHKVTLKEKISGGMKVFSGKLGHDKSKVEEGKKLMHGQSA